MNEVFLAFETSEQNPEKKKQPVLKRALSDASQSILSYTSSLADQAVSSSDIGSSEELKLISKKIKVETKKDIRQATINQREQEKKEISMNIKNELTTQQQSQNFNYLIQMQSMKMMQQLLNETPQPPQPQQPNPQLLQLSSEVTTLQTEIQEIKNSLFDISNFIKKL